MVIQYNDVLLLAGGRRIRCRRCSARSKRTKFVSPSFTNPPNPPQLSAIAGRLNDSTFYKVASC
jgi:hypothetical protein